MTEKLISWAGLMGIASQKTSHDVRVSVRSTFVPERSSPHDCFWLFAYEVRIENVGQDTVQLLRRYWEITDGDGDVREVEGPGVVGETPILAAGESFTYVSACPLNTEFGTMCGHYTMANLESGEHFDVEIAAFALCQPDILH